MRKPRAISSDRIDKARPAYRIIVGVFGGLTPFCKATGIATSTAHEWLIAGSIPNRRTAHILSIGHARQLRLAAVDFIDRPTRG